MATCYCCCLCRNPAPTDHRRRKKLHGASCAKAKAVLKEVLCVPLEALVETSDPTAVLCYNCERTLNNIDTLVTKAETLKEDIRKKGSALQSVTACSGIRPTTDTELPQATQICSDNRPSTPPSAGQPEGSLSTPTQVAQSQLPSTSAAVGEPSPPVQVRVQYKGGVQAYNIGTPSRKRCIKRITRKTYRSMASVVVNSPRMSKSVISQIATKIKAEMKDISSDAHDSILRDSIEAVKHFHWETVMLELSHKIPTLMSLLSQLVRQPATQKPLLCLLASQLLKSRHHHMGLVQRAVSVMMYGNATTKQVFENLQPLGVCMSYQGTMNIVEKISEDHDIQVQEWADELVHLIEKPSQDVETQGVMPTSVQPLILPDTDDSDDDIKSPEAPPCSPISFTDDILPICETVPEGSTDESDQEPRLEDETEFESNTRDFAPQANMWFGYKFVGDNIDKNVKPSLQRHELRGQSLHYFHGYAVRDRVDLSKLSDKPPLFSTPEPSVFLPSPGDLSSLREELEILVSRIIVQHMDEFKSQAKTVTRHIPSRHTKEMASKSVVCRRRFCEVRLSEYNRIKCSGAL